MNKIVAVGKPEFTVGFWLAGIQTVEIKDAQKRFEEEFEKLFAREEIGIIITDENTMNQLPPFFREIVESKVKPVTVVVSTDAASNDTLRKKIKKAIGVDLWSK